MPEALLSRLATRVEGADDPREAVIDVMYMIQQECGYLSDEGVEAAAQVLGMTPLEIEELATFYDFIYREPVGKLVIHVCDGVVCWMGHHGWLDGEESVIGYLCRKLGLRVGQTTADGLFTVLPSACIGHCENAPAMLINGKPYGSLTPESIDRILDELRREHVAPTMVR
jgi:NADH-quinone oxidoreductase subunit E